jgi:nitrite reductase/ring-hydroxylating ferredoxin subunit
VKTANQSILLLNHGGEIYAVNNFCPHMRAPLLKGKITEDGAIICPWHRSAFDLKSGDVKDWSPWPPGIGKALGVMVRQKALQVFPTRVDEAGIWIGLESAS